MPCDLSVITKNITLDCSDVPIGGITKVMVAKLDDITDLKKADGLVTDITIANEKVIDLEFNPKDGFSSFSDEKTVDDSQVVTAIPTVTLEFPKMTVKKRNALELLSSPGLELALFVETAAGVKHALGLEFGMQGSEVNAQSGTGRSEKNIYNITFKGEETNLAYLINDVAWGKLLTAVKPIA